MSDAQDRAAARPVTQALDLVRSVPFELVRAEGEPRGDGLTLTGYAAVFDAATRIDSWEGAFDEQIARGAFRKTIRERTPVLQFDHGQHPLVGSIPIGALDDLREDEQGLFVSARLSTNWLVEPVREAIGNGSVNGMSFRFQVVRDEWRDAAGKRITDPNELMELLWEAGDRGPLQRTLREVRMPELGPVVFPAYAQTSVSVRSRQVAQEIVDDEQMRRELRASLARSLSVPPPDGVDGVPAIEVARALIFGHRSAPAAVVTPEVSPADDGDEVRDDAPPTDGHPSDDQNDDAPLRSEHPSDDEHDAPLPGEHPSATGTTPQAERKRVAEDMAARVKAALTRMEKYQ